MSDEKAPATNALNKAHWAKYLLARLLTCGCCGGGYTVMGKDRYGCFTHRSKGASVCKNGKTISCFKLEDRVLRHVRRDLITPELAQALAAEVTRLLAAQEAEAQTSELAPALAEVERRIESLLDQIEDDPRPLLLDRLAEREAERDELKARIVAQTAARPRPKATLPEDLQALYADQVRRLNTLLTGSGHVIEANELLRPLIARVVLRPDPDAMDELLVELQGDLSWVPIGKGPGPRSRSLQDSLRGALLFQEQAPAGARSRAPPPRTTVAGWTGELAGATVRPKEPCTSSWALSRYSERSGRSKDTGLPEKSMFESQEAPGQLVQPHEQKEGHVVTVPEIDPALFSWIPSSVE